MKYMNSLSSTKTLRAFPVFVSIMAGIIGFFVLCSLAHVVLPIRKIYLISISIIVCIGILSRLWVKLRKGDKCLPGNTMAIMVLLSICTVMVLSTSYQLIAYISLPADLLSFAEAPFLNDIIKLRLGLPIYSIPQDNNNFPYTPGTQLLTYFISSVLGHGDSIPFYRVVQISYIILASFAAAYVCHLIACRKQPTEESSQGYLWFFICAFFLFLVTTDFKFNEYTHSLHNDGLAILFCVSAYLLIVKYSIAPNRWLLLLMAILPSLGFMIKQSQVCWIGIFFLYLLIAGDTSLKQIFAFLVGSLLFLVVTIFICYLIWGDQFIFWIFKAIGHKKVSVFRSIQHLLDAGIYAIMALAGGLFFLLQERSRKKIALWVCWFVLFSLETYTSGLGWHKNHMGPGIVIGTCWFFIAFIKVWPNAENTRSWWQFRAKELFAVATVILLFGGLGLVRVPLNPVPSDFYRYIEDIEKEFKGIKTDKVLMDTGNWIYLRENVLMKDRSESVGIWLGANEPSLKRDILSETIKRIENRKYDKILARQLDTDQTWYDFQARWFRYKGHDFCQLS